MAENTNDGLAGDLEMARELIQEAKGAADGPDGGYVTNHLDSAEHWIAKVQAILTRTPPPANRDAVPTSTASENALKRAIEAAGLHDAWPGSQADQDVNAVVAAIRALKLAAPSIPNEAVEKQGPQQLDYAGEKLPVGQPRDPQEGEAEREQAIERLDRCTWDSRVTPNKRDIRILLDAFRGEGK